MGRRPLFVFLSYPSERLEQAREIYFFLKSIGIDGWFDKESLIGGQDWERERGAAQSEADLTIIVCSPETVGRQGVIQREVKDALKRCRDVPLGHICLVPLRTEEFDLPEELHGYHYIDLFRAGWQFKLVRSIDLKFQQSNLERPQALITFIQAQEGASGIAKKTLKCVEGSFEAAADYFLYQRAGLFWDFVNSEITSTAVGGFMKGCFDCRVFLEGRDWKGSWSLRIDEQFSAGELVSLKCFEFADYGGAHPSRGIHTRNYDGSAGGKLKLEEIFGWNGAVLKYLKNYCETNVNLQLLSVEGNDQKYSLDNYMDEKSGNSWEIFSQWSFSNSGLSIALSEFSGLPFVKGVFEVMIPWEFFRDKISEEYRDTSLGRLIVQR